nr:MAG TPA: hypothetical protein [Bacteriophage sp.]
MSIRRHLRNLILTTHPISEHVRETTLTLCHTYSHWILEW